ncbi:MAG: OsmC family protein [Burkholderiales bacterium]|nr:OsmC family protein [Burkholderiales bacterium]MDE1927694.1 OsmC family protein [Burkholderiales bacterium]MDE2157999.1 OsmC family protein [Burkholderiales bacterium]MDE2502103.1 OsmC family protein [Burkholderiales bacterium]
MAHTHHAWIDWQRDAAEPFVDQRYSRVHRLRFDGGVEWTGSASPHVVPLPYSSAAAVDPEEMFVASLSSCHMLWFLALAAAQGCRVERYEDAALGTMARNAEGRMAMDLVVLRPRVVFGGAHRPDEAAVRALHHRAHEECFIANSVRTEVRCEPVFDVTA